MPDRRRLRSLVIAVVVLCSLTPAAAAEFQDPLAANPDVTTYSPAFEDVPIDYLFAGAIRAIFAAGVTVGCDNNSTRFCPDRTVTRGEMAAFITRALKLPEGPSTDFTDDNGHIFENAIQRIAAAGITLGCNPPANNRFCPNRTITRGEMAAFITRALKLPEGPSTDFTDDNGHIFENAIQRIAAAGITLGCNPPANNRFCPDRTITRGEMAAFITRAIDDIAAPPALPVGVTLEREATTDGYDIDVTVCRDAEQSVMVRSVIGAVPGYTHLKGWEPTSASIPGEFDRTSDRWFLPPSTGCEVLEMTWDPKANILVNPLDAMDVVSHFGPRLHPIIGGVRLHAGIDLDGETGDPIYASANGMVIRAGEQGGYGQMIDIKHPGGLVTRYAHLSELTASEGASVVAGALIGYMGCTGLCTGPHLHFETRVWDVPVDPLIYLP